MSLTVVIPRHSKMAPVDNMMSDQKSSCSRDTDGRNGGHLVSSGYDESSNLAESLSRLQLGIEISTDPCPQASSMNRTLVQLMRQMNTMKLDNEIKIKGDRCDHKEVELDKEKKVNAYNLKTEVKIESPAAEALDLLTEVKKEPPDTEVNGEISQCELQVENLKLGNKTCRVDQTVVKSEIRKTESCNAGSPQLIARGPDRNRTKDVYHPYLQHSSSSSSPESIVDPASPEGSPKSIVSDHRRQSGGSIIICRQPPGKFEIPEPPRVIQNAQNVQSIYRQKSGGRAIHIYPECSHTIPIPNSPSFADLSPHSACYTTSPAQYSAPSPSNIFSASRSPYQSMVPSPTQVISSTVASPSMYRDGQYQSSPESFVAYSPAQESISSPYPSSPSQQSLDYGSARLDGNQIDRLVNQLDVSCLASQPSGTLLSVESTRDDDSQVVPDDIKDIHVEPIFGSELPSGIGEFLINCIASDQFASHEMVEKTVNQIMMAQDQSSLLSSGNELVDIEPIPFTMAQNTTAVHSFSPSAAVSEPMLSPPQPQMSPSPTPTMHATGLINVTNKHPMLSDMLSLPSSDSKSTRTPVTVIVHHTENLIPSTVNPGTLSLKILPPMTPPPPPTSCVRPKTRRTSGKNPVVVRTTTPRPIAPKPSPSQVMSTAPVASPSRKDETPTPCVMPSRDEVHSRLLETFDDVTRRKMNQAIQSIPDEDIFKKDANRGDTMAHMAIRGKKTLLSVNLIDRYVLKSTSNLNILNNAGQTLLLCAAMTLQENLTEYLLLSGADPNQLVLSSGSTALHCLAEQGSSFASVLDKVCAFPGTNLNKHNSDGRTPLICALESHGREIGTDSNPGFIDAIPVIRTLLQRGASLAVCCRCAGKTALHLAVLKKNLVLAQLLCSEYPRIKEAINIQAYDGNTALHYAAGMSEWTLERQLQMVRLLLHYGASTTETNNETKIPADLVDKDRKEIKKLLKPPGGRRGSSN